VICKNAVFKMTTVVCININIGHSVFYWFKYIFFPQVIDIGLVVFCLFSMRSAYHLQTVV